MLLPLLLLVQLLLQSQYSVSPAGVCFSLMSVFLSCRSVCLSHKCVWPRRAGSDDPDLCVSVEKDKQRYLGSVFCPSAERIYKTARG